MLAENMLRLGVDTQHTEPAPQRLEGESQHPGLDSQHIDRLGDELGPVSQHVAK
jgi:hypothetical protein